jgi:glycosyltransferase involved in cell wall biosynthesis
VLCRYPVTLGRDTGARRQTRQSLGVDDDDVVVAIAARMEAWKGHRPLIEALGRIQADPRWTCWVIGGAQTDGERAYQQTLHELARRQAVSDRIRFLGQREDVPALLAAADIYCQPNLGGEPFGISFIEALKSGIPVVTTSIGAAPELVDETCGCLVGPGDIEALGSALGALVDAPDRRRALGAAGPGRAQTLCAPETQIPMIEALLGSLGGTRAQAVI